MLDSVLLIDPESPIALDLKGVILNKQNQYEKAIDILNKVVENEPDFAIAWYNLSIALKGKGEYQKAKKYLDKAIELRSDLTKAYFERALVSKALDDKISALEDYNKIIDMRGEQYMEAYLNRGLTLKLLGDYEGALSDLNKVVANAPENAEAYKNRANLYLLLESTNKPSRISAPLSHSIEIWQKPITIELWHILLSIKTIKPAVTWKKAMKWALNLQVKK